MADQVDPDDLERLLLALSPSDFERFFIQLLLANSSRFGDVGHLGAGKRHLIDVYAIDREHAEAPTYFELKRRAVVFPDVVRAVGAVAERLRATEPDARVVLVVPGLPTREVASVAAEQRVAIWGKLSLAALATPEIVDAYRPLAREDAATGSSRKESERLARLLDEIPRGREDALRYQDHVTQIFEHLFVPPLASPRVEHRDEAGRNRRDAIFEKLATSGFWDGVRRTYGAEYIVLDAKNHTDGPDKDAVLAVAHYLKPYGCGMFAIIAGRTAPTDAARHAAREQWIGGQKMIVFVSDDDIRSMLDLLRQGGAPEEILRRRIADFRLSL